MFTPEFSALVIEIADTFIVLAVLRDATVLATSLESGFSSRATTGINPGEVRAPRDAGEIMFGLMVAGDRDEGDLLPRLSILIVRGVSKLDAWLVIPL